MLFCADPDLLLSLLSLLSLLLSDAPGILFMGVGIRIANNSIVSTPHFAIAGDGNDNLFEHNKIRHACFGTTDSGAFYGEQLVPPSHISLGADKSPSCCSAGQSWSERGNVVRKNLFHTVRATERLAQAATTQNAFYLDVGAQQLSPKTLLSVRFDLSADRT